MSAERHELEAAYYKGLQEMNGMDPEVARDLGFVTNPDEFEATLASHENTSPAADARRADHLKNIELYHTQTDEQRAWKPTPEEQASSDVSIKQARAAAELSHIVFGRKF